MAFEYVNNVVAYETSTLCFYCRRVGPLSTSVIVYNKNTGVPVFYGMPGFVEGAFDYNPMTTMGGMWNSYYQTYGGAMLYGEGNGKAMAWYFYTNGYTYFYNYVS